MYPIRSFSGIIFTTKFRVPFLALEVFIQLGFCPDNVDDGKQDINYGTYYVGDDESCSVGSIVTHEGGQLKHNVVLISRPQ